LMFTACSSDSEFLKNDDSQLLRDEESKNLEKMHAEIIALSDNSKTCTNSNDWDFVAVGSKTCGGPEEYIIYSVKIDTTDFLSKIKTYNAKLQEFNTKWEINSICDVVPEPEGVDCVNGKPTLIYASDRNLEEQNLEKLYAEIISFSENTKSCQYNDWDFTPIGSQPCGGSKKYIVYSVKIDRSEFFNKIKTYNAKEAEFNNKWKVKSTCDVVYEPEAVDCVNDKPTLIYKSDRDAETENLKRIYDEIITMSLVNSQECTNPSEWAYTGIGEKSCGGPIGYIPYSLKINVKDFLDKVNLYTIKEMEFNKRWKVTSDCSVPAKPIGIDCKNGKATLIY